MGYNPMTEQDIYNIFRLYHAGESFSDIEQAEQRDKKTIRLYIK